MKKKIIFYCMLLIMFATNTYSSVGDWTTLTNMGDVRDLEISNNSIWGATNGGVFKYNLADSTYEIYTNTNGLTSIIVNTIEIDQYENVWVGMADGYINVYKADTKQWDVIDDYLGHVIYDLESSGDSLFVALHIGVSLYNISQREVKETYKNLGQGFQVEIPVKHILINGKDIWAGTDYGIAKSNLDIVNLLDPESWTNYTVEKGQLLSNKIQSITSLTDGIWITTDKGISKYDGINWSIVSSTLNASVILQSNNIVYAGLGSGVYQFDGTNWTRLGDTFRDVISLVITESGELWAGKVKNNRYSSEGLARYNAVENIWEHISPPGPAGNNFKGLAIDHNGVLWCCTKYNGIVSFDGTEWKNYKIRPLGYSNDGLWGVKIDSYNNKWFACWGAGLVKLDVEDSITVYNKDYLSGIKGGPTYIPVTNVDIDDNDIVWCTVYGAVDGNVVSATTAQDTLWQQFSANDGILTNIDNEIYGLEIDSENRVWVGSVSGVTVFDTRNTLMDKSDDNYLGTLTTVDGLLGNDVRSLAEDYDNIMWIGTNKGLNKGVWEVNSSNNSRELKIYEKDGLISDNIQTIAVDVKNNKWIGTGIGISVLTPDDETWIHYTTENSPLVSPIVTAFAFDELTGKVYIGTTNGLSMLQTAYVKPKEKLDEVIAGPNPFLLENNQKFTIKNLTSNVSVKFFTENGMLIRSISKEGICEWDGRNDADEFVSSGIYIYLVFDEDTGTSKVGKVAVIR